MSLKLETQIQMDGDSIGLTIFSVFRLGFALYLKQIVVDGWMDGWMECHLCIKFTPF